MALYKWYQSVFDFGNGPEQLGITDVYNILFDLEEISSAEWHELQLKLQNYFEHLRINCNLILGPTKEFDSDNQLFYYTFTLPDDSNLDDIVRSLPYEMNISNPNSPERYLYHDNPRKISTFGNPTGSIDYNSPNVTSQMGNFKVN